MAEVGGEPISVIARQMDMIRDDFIAELFDDMKAEIRGLNHDTRMLNLWRASLTENVVAAIHYLERDSAAPLVEAPAAALAYARASAQRDVPLSALVRAHRIGLAWFLEVAMQYVSLLEPAQRVPTIIELVNRSTRLVDLVADQLTVAYEQEHDRSVSRRSGPQQRWVGEVLAGPSVDVQRAEKVLGYRLEGVHIAALVWVDAKVPTRDVVALFDQVRSWVTAELGAVGRSLMVPTDEREARLWFSVGSARNDRTLDPSRVRTAFESAGIQAHLAFGRVEDGLRGFRASLKQAELVKAVVLAGGDRPSPRVVFYSEVAPIALMASDVDELRRFVSDVLGELGVDDERNGWLRETLREFLARNRSYVATADAMILHRNTIQYRVAQAMELCGQSFDDPRRRVPGADSVGSLPVDGSGGAARGEPVASWVIRADAVPETGIVRCSDEISARWPGLSLTAGGQNGPSERCGRRVRTPAHDGLARSCCAHKSDLDLQRGRIWCLPDSARYRLPTSNSKPPVERDKMDLAALPAERSARYPHAPAYADLHNKQRTNASLSSVAVNRPAANAEHSAAAPAMAAESSSGRYC